MSNKILDKDLLDEIIRIKELLGKNPKQEDIAIHSKFSLNSYKRAFGGLGGALIKIGENPTYITGQNKEDVISEIKRLYKELNRIPKTSEFTRLSSMSFQTLRKICNKQSWHSLLSECGATDAEISKLKKHHVTSKELKEEILRLKSFLGRYPTYIEMAKEGKFSCNTYEEKFGSWAKAFKALGFDDYVSQSIYKNQIHAKGNDGNIYRSNFESRAANFLYTLKNKNEILTYEYERRVCIGKIWTCDFVITKNSNEEIWLELDGMLDKRKEPYDKSKKIDFYKHSNINYYIYKYASSKEKIETDIYNIIFEEK
ncbi:MAG: homing endonuclease associated repeat-containing protein [Bacteroidia bacterium]